jgi:hypothetical protein
MSLLLQLLQYGQTDSESLKQLTPANWNIVKPKKLDVTRPADYYRGDQILLTLENQNEIRECEETYKATNFDGLCAQLISNGIIDGNESLYERIRCPHKIATAIDKCWYIGVPILGVAVNGGSHGTVVIVGNDEPQAGINYPYNTNLMCNRELAYNRLAYCSAGATHINIIRATNKKFVIQPADACALFVDTILALNLRVANYMLTIIDKDLFTATYVNSEVIPQIMNSVMVMGDAKLVNEVAALCRRNPISFIGASTNLLIMKKFPPIIDDVPTGLITAGQQANLQLMDYWLSKAKSSSQLLYLAQGAAAGGNGSILNVCCAVMDELTLLTATAIASLMTISFYFDNYHCIALLTEYDGYKSNPSANVLPPLFFGNLPTPKKPGVPIWFNEWFDSFYS